MKAHVSLLAVSLAVGAALAQTTPSTPRTQDPQQKTMPSDSKGNPKDMKDSKAASANPAEMKTSMFKGILVDMSCAGQGSASTATSPAASATPSADKANSANRAASDSGSSCNVSANSKEFGLKMEDGKTVPFDLVGNQRAQDAVKNEKSWNKDISTNKPIHAKVSGVMSGDHLIVASIH